MENARTALLEEEGKTREVRHEGKGTAEPTARRPNLGGEERKPVKNWSIRFPHCWAVDTAFEISQQEVFPSTSLFPTRPSTMDGE